MAPGSMFSIILIFGVRCSALSDSFEDSTTAAAAAGATIPKGTSLAILSIREETPLYKEGRKEGRMEERKDG
ncbi:hypothetical protein BKA81DRAFT_25631 [Phyllosticta paracitricarpa]